MKPQYLIQLRTIAPNLAFSAKREKDESFVWDGDGPNPEREGYFAYDVEVIVRAIVNGQVMSSHAYLGGSYFKPDEAMGNIHGYMPQMLEEAAADLLPQLKGSPLEAECSNAIRFLEQVMSEIYEQEMKGAK